jgi:hypothetical protein
MKTVLNFLYPTAAILSFAFNPFCSSLFQNTPGSRFGGSQLRSPNRDWWKLKEFPFSHIQFS